MSKPPDLVQGTPDLLLLKIVALEPQHGWAITQRLKQVSNDQFRASDGSVSAALVPHPRADVSVFQDANAMM